jgi:PhoH-like ATPase
LKKFLVDTNVIMLDPYCVNKLGGKILLTTTVLEELDKHKTDNGEKGRNIREFARLIDKNELTHIEFIHTDYESIPVNDDRIIEAARETKSVLVTNDILMSIKARAVGIKTQRYESVGLMNDSAYTGMLDVRGKSLGDFEPKYPNQFFIMDKGVFYLKGNNAKRLSKDKKVWGISHRNVEQKCAIEALLDDDIKLVTISGKAGTGKTLLAIACGLEKVINDNSFIRLLVSRPVIPMGNDIGYLPGDINEKLGPWMQPIFDNIDYLFNMEGHKQKKSFDAYLELANEGILKVEALTYIRGRSIPDHYIIIDEAQNLSKHEVKTIISRAGENTKIIMTGDPDQIDNPKLDSINNGLTYVIEQFKDQKVAAHITLSKCERSELADVAAEVL